MFVNEARISALLNHPNIVAGLRLRSGRRRLLPGHGVPARAGLSRVLRALRARERACRRGGGVHRAGGGAGCLDYAHTCAAADGKRLKIVHRDVSPSNIMCLRTGGVKLLDFGIAKAAGDAARDDQAGSGQGEARIPLARADAANEAIDGRVDVFALGVVLWEMLAGRRLFRGDDEFETMSNVLEMPVPPPSALPRRCARGAGRDRDARAGAGPRRALPDGQAMADDLEPICARPPPTRGCSPTCCARRSPPTSRRARSAVQRHAGDAREADGGRGAGAGNGDAAVGGHGEHAAAMELATRIQHGGRGGRDRDAGGLAARAGRRRSLARRGPDSGTARRDGAGDGSDPTTCWPVGDAAPFGRTARRGGGARERPSRRLPKTADAGRSDRTATAPRWSRRRR